MASLTDRDRNLLRVARQSMSQAVVLYGKTFGGREGVERELERIRATIEGRIDRRLHPQTDPDRPWETLLEEDEHDVAGVPVRSVSSVRVSDGVAVISPCGDPPVAVTPSVGRFDVQSVEPAPLRMTSAMLERRARVLGLLRERSCSAAALAYELGLRRHSVAGVLSRLEQRGEVRRGGFAFDWPDANHLAKPSRVWEITGQGRAAPDLLPLPQRRMDVRALWRKMSVAERAELLLCVLDDDRGMLLRAVVEAVVDAVEHDRR